MYGRLEGTIGNLVYILSLSMLFMSICLTFCLSLYVVYVNLSYILSLNNNIMLFMFMSPIFPLYWKTAVVSTYLSKLQTSKI